MKNISTLIFVTSLTMLTACSTNNLKNHFTYKNPISQGIDKKGIRDCQVLRDGDWWYLTGTSYPHWDGKVLNKGVPLYRSKDLKNWEFIDYIVKRPAANKWYYKRFWAPEIHKINSKYYVTFNCINPEEGYTWQHMGYAVADKITGPYKIITENKPLARGNDLTFFVDDDGKTYAFFHNLKFYEFGIGFAEIDLESAKFLTKPQSAITAGRVDFEYDEDGVVKKYRAYNRWNNKIKKHYSWDSGGIEGAYVIKRNGIYYLFYSSWTRGYEVGYATAKKITGPWTKGKNNPIYSIKNSKNNKFSKVGHNAVFKGLNGKYWLSCHGILKKNKTPFLVIDQINFNNDGYIEKMSPTSTPQKVVIP